MEKSIAEDLIRKYDWWLFKIDLVITKSRIEGDYPRFEKAVGVFNRIIDRIHEIFEETGIESVPRLD